MIEKNEETASDNDSKDVNASIDMKTIQEIFKYTFMVPSYQRGYRWKQQQVKDLLGDIQEFSEKTDKTAFYCLQPIVVKKDDQAWELLDGQQRLTTIYMILKVLECEDIFSIDYSTRNESQSFLEKITKGTDHTPISTDNIDIHHFKKSLEVIREWFNKNKDKKEEWRKCLLERSKVIWYEAKGADSIEGSIAVFTRLNSGKIPLTNSELIRALFLHSSQTGTNTELGAMQQRKIASEWDHLEQELHDEDFWCFVTLGSASKKVYPNRIEFLLEMVERKQPGYKENKDDPHSTFRMYNDKIAGKGRDKESVEVLWQEVKEIHYRFHEWYIDYDLYHLIGYVLCVGYAKATMAPVKGAPKNGDNTELLQLSVTMKQSELKSKIRDIIREEHKEVKLDELTYGDAKVKNTLLLFNVETSRLSRLKKFPFVAYIKGKWDIEHIHSVNDPDKNGALNIKQTDIPVIVGAFS